MAGVWENHPQHGTQLRAVELERSLPEDEDEIICYLSSGVCKGVGPATAQRIVDRFGAQALDILEREPERLTTLKGITAKKAQEIAESFRRHMGLRRLMAFLARYQLPPVLAMQLRRQYGDAALEKVQENPYLLSGDVCGVAFSVTDEIALGMGIDPDSRQRLQAAVTFELSHNENNGGHVFLPRDKLIGATAQLLSCGTEQVEEALDQLLERGAVVQERVANVEACYLRRLWEAERSACARLLGLLASPADTSGQAAQAVEEIQRQPGHHLRTPAAAGGGAGRPAGRGDPHRRPWHRQDHGGAGHCGSVGEDGTGHSVGGPHGPGSQAHERADRPGGPDHPPDAGYELEREHRGGDLSPSRRRSLWKPMRSFWTR